MTEIKGIPSDTYRDMLQLVSQKPKQELHQTKIVDTFIAIYYYKPYKTNHLDF